MGIKPRRGGVVQSPVGGRQINFFCSVEQAREWMGTQDRPGRTITLDEVAAAGPALRGMMRT